MKKKIELDEMGTDDKTPIIPMKIENRLDVKALELLSKNIRNKVIDEVLGVLRKTNFYEDYEIKEMLESIKLLREK
jgi:hypothetical protein